MKQLILKSYAKINLTIDILSKRNDGYHNVEMIMQSISLADKLYFQKIAKGIEIESNHTELPTGKENLVYQAAKILFRKYDINQGIKVKINKNIPLAAGLAGGSGNAAATLLAVNKLWNLNLSAEQLLFFAAQLGADIPFCLRGGTYLATGIGTELEELASAPEMHLVVVKPPFSVSTSEIYQKLKLEEITVYPQTAKVISGLEKKEEEIILDNTKNILEEVTFNLYPELSQLKQKVKQITEKVLMSGSGPTILGFVKNSEQALEVKESLTSQLGNDYKIFTAKTIKRGIKEI